MADFRDETLDHETQRCVECGAPLTRLEQQRVIDDGLPALCTVHATEAEAVVEGDEDGP